ncbi:MAG: hypothetical protein ABSH15_01260 [Verrucomicrobiota bacterium]|jgi:hypothetical protein
MKEEENPTATLQKGQPSNNQSESHIRAECSYPYAKSTNPTAL